MFSTKQVKLELDLRKIACSAGNGVFTLIVTYAETETDKMSVNTSAQLCTNHYLSLSISVSISVSVNKPYVKFSQLFG